MFLRERTRNCNFQFFIIIYYYNNNNSYLYYLINEDHCIPQISFIFLNEKEIGDAAQVQVRCCCRVAALIFSPSISPSINVVAAFKLSNLLYKSFAMLEISMANRMVILSSIIALEIIFSIVIISKINCENFDFYKLLIFFFST